MEMDYLQTCRVMSRYLRFIEKYARLLAVLLILLGLGACSRIRLLTIESDWGQLFPYPEDADSVKALSAISSSAGLTFIFSDISGGPILHAAVGVRACVSEMEKSGLFQEVLFSHDVGARSAPPDMMLAFVNPVHLETLTRRLTGPGLDAFIGDSVNMLFSPAGGVMTTMLRQDPLQIARLAAEGVELRSGYHIQDGYLVSSDGSELMVIAIPEQQDVSSTDLNALHALMTRLRDLAGAAGLRCRMPGSVFLRAELYTSVQRDIVKSASISFLAVFVLFCIVFRGAFRIVLCIMLPLVFSLLATFSLYTFYSRSIDLITAMSAVMLVGLGVDFGIHLMMRYVLETGDLQDRLRRALSGTGKGILSSALTTAVAFFSILFTGMKSFYLLGIAAGGGILLAAASFFLVFPVCVALLRPARRRGNEQLDWIVALIRRMQPLRWLLIAFLIAGSFFLPRLHFLNDYRMFLPANSLVMKDMYATVAPSSEDTADALIVRVESQGYRADSLLVDDLVSIHPQSVWKTPYSLLPSWKDMDALREGLRTFCAQHNITSGSTQEQLRKSYMARELQYPESLDDYVDAIFAALQPGYWEDLLYTIPLVRPFFVEDQQELLLMATHADGRKWSQEEVDRVDALIAQHNRAGSGISTELLLDKVRRRCIPESALALGITLIIILVIMWMHFHNWRYIVLVLIPLVCGMWMTCIIMGLFNISFNFFNLPVIPLIFGLGIDDGIHFMQALKEHKSLTVALHDTGSAIVLTTLTTCLGFGTLTLVSFPGIALMGLMLVTGLVCCLLATLLILPLLCRRFLRAD
ncbi:MAG: hypothetical protein EOM20_11970 [Spartobacteria bacterium]|nr:hypothetical protein [Spartobacteria bacterium]